MAVFYSFHYERDVKRVQLVRNIGVIEGQKLLNAQEWESVRARGEQGIKNWIEEQMKYKTAVVVLIGRETWQRPWVRYEIQKAWNEKKPILGIRIHGISSMGSVDLPGQDPFIYLDGYQGRNPGIPIFDPTQRNYLGQIDSQATYRFLANNLKNWIAQGRYRTW